jgi:hypothetical protein
MNKHLLPLVIAMAAAVTTAMSAGHGRAADERSSSRALILVGLPGDKEHEKLFADTAQAWKAWLIGPLGLDPAQVVLLHGFKELDGKPVHPHTRADVERALDEWKRSLKPTDRVWVFLLGHANDDGKHAWFHLPGPDVREDQLAKLFAGIPCREQVFWVTTPAAGRFQQALSTKGRIVAAASRTEEDNETEFPQALSAVMQRPAAALDANHDGKVSVLEFYTAVVAEVQARYKANNRMATEHAQLDDRGDAARTFVLYKEPTTRQEVK